MPRKKSTGEKYRRQDVSIEPRQMEKLITYCRKEERSISWVIRQALALYFEQHNI